jgi:hypothetical protein
MKYFIDKTNRLWEVGKLGSRILHIEEKGTWEEEDYPLTEMELDGKNILPKEYGFREISENQFKAVFRLTIDRPDIVANLEEHDPLEHVRTLENLMEYLDREDSEE